ncbi:septal ring lytic transglycosylase RlpA family protein [Mangrovimonas sp. TPBH4]|uniref:septal ring lytic transglycosylase RlpA family protein n=1 Tax=Mangrovimonas sp. TPBH4 TaxID=1645914 RepID=UPI0006B55BA8|nr:septal ring lytic transglycosylase RlpA family protein [Mangrovimonas sp. TPBH4]
MKPIILLALAMFSTVLTAQVQTGKASFYGDKFEGRLTASGEPYSHKNATAAHRSLPFGTMLKVTNLANNKTAYVKVNDRGPFVSGRIIDLSKSIAEKLDFVAAGVADVVIEVLDAGDLSTPNSEATVSTAPENTSTISNPITAAPIESEFYELTIDRVKPDWIGVQIGSFQELANLIRLADNLKVSYQKEVTVQVKTINGVKIYSLILGKFNTRSKAEHFRDRVEERYPDCFIVNLTTS